MWERGVHVDMFIATFILLLMLWGIPSSRMDGTVTVTNSTAVRIVEKNRICGSIDIRNSIVEFEQLRGCSVVEGFVRIVLIDSANSSDFENLSFPELREITGYLILYHVKRLKNLGVLFPNLTVIRGDTLFHDYALVVYNMADLEELRLWSLTAILRGSVRIENNNKLCYYNTVNWDLITNGGKNYIENNNNNARLCPSNDVCEVDNCLKSMCWGSDVQNCRKRDQENLCHPLCLGGCTGPRADQCFVCKGVLNDGQCVSNCPPDKYSYLGRRCITSEECRSIKSTLSVAENVYGGYFTWLPFNKTCVHQCGGALVTTIADSQHLRGCTIITSSLEIAIRGSESYILQELEENLASIKEIRGYLKVSRSFPLTSLNFLKNLEIIHGNELKDGRYSLLVFENQNLQELWNWSSRPPLKVRNGTLKFHYNPKLCLSEIDKLLETTGLQNCTNFDVSRESNGDKVACNVLDLSANVTVMSSKTVLIEWEPTLLADPSSVLGYMVYYIEAPERNVTEHDGLDACGHKTWNVVDFPYDENNTPHSSSADNLIRFLAHLQPFTQYAYYIKTYTKTNTGGQSKIQYFRTLPDRPSVPREICAVSNSSSSITIQWLPPEFPNGILSHYIVSGKWFQDDQLYLDQRNYCKHPFKHLPNPDVHKVPSSTSKTIDSHCCCGGIEPEPLVLIEDADDYQKICLSPVRTLKDEVSICENYFYSFVQTGLPELLNLEDNSLGDRFPDQLYASSEPQEQLPFNQTIKNGEGVYEQFLERIDAKTPFTVLQNLQHFAEYTINVYACREPHSSEPQSSVGDGVSQIDYQSLCSPAGIVSIRTKALSTADKIEYSHLSVVSITSKSVKLAWKEPRKPNGVILTYIVEHKHIDIENFHPVIDCISRKEYIEYGGGFVLHNLTPGNYTFRVKATSLAGEGHFTDALSFVIEEPLVESNRPLLVGIILASLLVLVGVTIITTFLWQKRKARSLMIITSANPDYMSAAGSIYVEDEWEVSREEVELIREIGKGSFGMVYEGLLKPNDVPCAVKMINDRASAREKKEFLNEASMMKSFAGAHHVVNLLGVVSRGQPALVIMELMVRGDLKSYLRTSREPPHLQPDVRRMLLMAAQIADGMAYLEAHKFVHRDLAARNCMVAEDLTIKIGDFGMTRDVYETDYYRYGIKGALPVRWMSPESLAVGVFTSQSDVWSFGVVLWEITTLAEQPYQGLANEQVLQYVLEGGILERPHCCPDILYQFMLDCWHKRPSRRPRFLQIVASLESVSDLGSKFKECSFYHSKEGQENKENLDEKQEVVDDDISFDDDYTKSPPIPFCQLIEEKTALLKVPASHIGRSVHCDIPQSKYKPISQDSGNSHSSGSSTLPNLNAIPDDSYVLPSSLMGASGRYTFGQPSSETECLLASELKMQQNPSMGNTQIQNISDISPKRKESWINVPIEEASFVLLEDTYFHPNGPAVIRSTCGENSANCDCKKVSPDQDLEISQTCVPKRNISTNSGLDSCMDNACVPALSNDSSIRHITKITSPTSAEEVHTDSSENYGDMDKPLRPPNGMVYGYISVPHKEDVSEVVGIFN